MKLSTISDFLERHAPLSYQEQYDNSGLLIGAYDQEITAALVCLDVTEEILEEAILTGVNLIIAHHPLIFSGLKRLTGSNYVQRIVEKSVRNHIAIYAIHTNLDNTLIAGVNTRFAEQLELKDLRPIRPDNTINNPDIPKGIGLIGTLVRPMAATEFLSYVKSKMLTACIRYTQSPSDMIHSVAICGGSGSFLLQDAIRLNADAFITGDFKYHDFFDGPGNIMILDIGHYESEQFTMDLLVALISEKFSNFAVRKTKHISNPVKYF